jgi:hypothetical protein
VSPAISDSRLLQDLPSRTTNLLFIFCYSFIFSFFFSFFFAVLGFEVRVSSLLGRHSTT